MTQGELVPRAPRTMVFQKDIDGTQIGPDRYALALALRELAQRLGVSLGRYSVRVPWDRSTLSRYFSGALVPPAEFVERLIDDGNRETGTELTSAARGAVRKLHRTALRVTSPHSADLQDLRDKLAEADRESRHLHQEARLLREMVRSAHEHLDDQQARLRQLEQAGAAARLVHRAELDQRTTDFDSLQAERDELQETLIRLTAELAEAERRALDAEERCIRLEQQLDTAEAQAEELDAGAERKVATATDTATARAANNPGISIQLGITREAGARLTRTLDEQVPLPLTEEQLRKLLRRPGIYQLLRGGPTQPKERMYVGKAERSLPQRLDFARRRILGRKYISLDDMYFTYLYVEDDLSAVAPENLVLKHLQEERGVSLLWNHNGFSISDPGRRRDLAQLKPQHFNVAHPIDLDWSLRHDGRRQWFSPGDFVTYLKAELPYAFRQALEPDQPEEVSLEVPQGPLSADTAFRLLARNLGESWQISALKGHVILYEENTEYPNALRYYRGETVSDA
ncbi:helix-turn-helix domain-containing protein [Streptomyces sp. NPDC020807]|uniref:helix-turn-helix domain-containing protein n=1 Tax=Streptomyces sp. NPDC020807 TaxID=3155119 RepID=UPI0034028C3A